MISRRASAQSRTNHGDDQQPSLNSKTPLVDSPSSNATPDNNFKWKIKRQSHKRPLDAPGTNVHSTYAGISVHNALLQLKPPPQDAKPGGKHLPWLQLTDWEMMQLRKRMKKNAKWQPSDDMIRKELLDLGRGAKAREEARKCGTGFEDLVMEESGEAGSGKRELDDRDFEGLNRGMRLNVAKKRKRERTKDFHCSSRDGTSHEESLAEDGPNKRQMRGLVAGQESSIPTPEVNTNCGVGSPEQDANQAKVRIVTINGTIKTTSNRANQPNVDTSSSGSRSLEASASKARTIAPLDLVELSSTKSDTSSKPSTDEEEMSAFSLDKDGLTSSESDKSSADSSLGNGSMLLSGTNISKQSQGFHGLETKSASKIRNGAKKEHLDPATSPPSAKDRVPKNLSATEHPLSRVVKEPQSQIRRPEDCKPAVLVNPASRRIIPEAPISSYTAFSRQAREILNASVIRSTMVRHSDTGKIKLKEEKINTEVSGVRQNSQVATARSPEKATIPSNHAGYDRILTVPSPTRSGSKTPANAAPHDPASCHTPQAHSPSELKQALVSALSEEYEKRDRGSFVSDEIFKKAFSPTGSVAEAAEMASRCKKWLPPDSSAARVANIIITVYQSGTSTPCNTKIPSISRSPNARRVANRPTTPALDATKLLSTTEPPSSKSLKRFLPPPSPTVDEVEYIDMTTFINPSPTPITLSSSNRSVSNASSDLPTNPTSATPSSIQAPNTSTPTVPSSIDPSQSVNSTNLQTKPTTATSPNIAAAPDTTTRKLPSLLNPSKATYLVLPPANPTTTAAPTTQFSPTPKPLDPPPLPPQPAKPPVPGSVAGGSGVMAWNRARRKARLAAQTASANANDSPQIADGAVLNGGKVNEKRDESGIARHQRLKDFIVGGKVS